MNNDKTTSIFRTAKDRQEFVRALRKMTMSGAVSEDAAIEKLIRDNPHYIRRPTEDELKKSFHEAMNDAMRSRALQPTSRPTYDIFANVIPTDKKTS